ncbi:hypothetical protein TSO5_28540 [Azospirillum sp. TSO5]|nr:sensor histidine kinase N-terminal domain-containing protein [Azospirillum sp. TSO5]PWC84078.1 hypothetical protein TSO5_28540 [Azospirillum sp. TSO5]
MSPPSLLGRIVLRLSLTTAVAILCAYGWIWYAFQSTTGVMRDQSLIDTARAIARSIHAEGEEPAPRIDLSPALIASYVNARAVRGFAIRDRDSGAILLAAGAEVGPVPEHLEEDEDGSLYQYNPDGPGPANFFGEALPIRRGEWRLVVQVVRLGTDYQELMDIILVDFFEDGWPDRSCWRCSSCRS